MDITTLVATEAVGGFAVGALIGYATKAILKITAIGLGFFFLILLWLSSSGLIIVNWPAIQTWLSNLLTNLFGQNLSGTFSLGVLGTAGVGGFFYGLGKHEIKQESRLRFNRPRFNKSRIQLSNIQNRIKTKINTDINKINANINRLKKRWEEHGVKNK
ncbi:MAG: FUN14 domain-containing protein [Thermocladium sp.]